ncbi:hypothetical protein [Candidatus Poriferisocius sp.]|uniref:hypothetical protein n=1 Tax=Candidatus Poriferisocius sp. TaxID=3101276 RepID=UPI003B59751F
MPILRLLLPLVLACFVAAACSSDSEDSAPSVAATEPPSAETTQPAQTPAPEPTEAEDGLSTAQQELADAIFTAMLEDDERPAAVTEDQVRCLGDSIAGVFSNDRLGELGITGTRVIEAYTDRGTFALGDDYDITDSEASQVVDLSLQCMDWRTVIASAITLEGIPADQANCIASELSDESIRSSVESGLISQSEDDLGIAQSEAMGALQACLNVRDMLFETFIQDGLSEPSARCVADGLPDELVEMMLEGPDPEDEEAVLEMMGELQALQNRCLTPEEIESMGGSSSLQ